MPARPAGTPDITDTDTDAGYDVQATELIVGSYLGVSVIRSKLLAKKVGESKTHPGYEVGTKVTYCMESYTACICIAQYFFLSVFSFFVFCF